MLHDCIMHLAQVVLKKCDTWFLGFFCPCLWAYFISVLYMLHMCSCEPVLDIMFFLKVSILYYPVIHLAHSWMSVKICCLSKLREHLIILLYILHMVVSNNKEDSIFKKLLYNRINQLGLHPSL
jgi:hypothetical protein